MELFASFVFGMFCGAIFLFLYGEAQARRQKPDEYDSY